MHGSGWDPPTIVEASGAWTGASVRTQPYSCAVWDLSRYGMQSYDIDLPTVVLDWFGCKPCQTDEFGWFWTGLASWSHTCDLDLLFAQFCNLLTRTPPSCASQVAWQISKMRRGWTDRMCHGVTLLLPCRQTTDKSKRILARWNHDVAAQQTPSHNHPLLCTMTRVLCLRTLVSLPQQIRKTFQCRPLHQHASKCVVKICHTVRNVSHVNFGGFTQQQPIGRPVCVLLCVFPLW